MILRRLYYTSDTHHEMRGNAGSSAVEITPIQITQEERDSGIEGIRNFLALCGDIGNPYDVKYKNFIQKHSLNFEKVFVISGNHEYYSNKKQKTITDIEEKIREVCAEFNNVHYLQRDSYTIDDVTFLGCTLWTPVNQSSETNMNDYVKIYIEDTGRREGFFNTNRTGFGGYAKRKFIREGRRLIRWSDIHNMHNQMKIWIGERIDELKRIDQIKNCKVIVLTHHAPIVDMIGEGCNAKSEVMDNKNNEEDLKYCYAGKCEDLFKSPLICWISGHTHSCINVKINDIPSLSNCWGYPGQKTGLDTARYFSF